LLRSRCRLVAIGDGERHMPVWLLILGKNQPPEGIGETGRHLVPRLSFADPRVGSRSQMVAISRLADHGRKTKIVKDPAEHPGIEGDRG
jgi:hypothetical protein